jgi:hypothetical protein
MPYNRPRLDAAGAPITLNGLGDVATEPFFEALIGGRWALEAYYRGLGVAMDYEADELDGQAASPATPAIDSVLYHDLTYSTIDTVTNLRRVQRPSLPAQGGTGDWTVATAVPLWFAITITGTITELEVEDIVLLHIYQLGVEIGGDEADVDPTALTTLIEAHSSSPTVTVLELSKDSDPTGETITLTFSVGEFPWTRAANIDFTDAD